MLERIPNAGPKNKRPTEKLMKRKLNKIKSERTSEPSKNAARWRKKKTPIKSPLTPKNKGRRPMPLTRELAVNGRNVFSKIVAGKLLESAARP